MKNILFFIVVLSVTVPSFAQKKAVTENGDPVILYENGTWKYAEAPAGEDSAIRSNPTEFKKTANSSFLIKSKNGKLGIWLDTKKWKFGKPNSSDAAEFEFELKGKSVNATFISEPLSLSLLALKKIAVKNAMDASPDFRILKEEYRMVNGLKVLHLQGEGTNIEIKFVYNGYYYSNDSAIVQFVVFQLSNSAKKYEKDTEELLNGLVDLT